MANLSTKIYNVANRLLKEGEEIRAVGQFSSGWHPLVGITLAALGGALACFTFGISLVLSLIGMLILASATKFWYVSVTNQRVIFTQLSFWGTPDVNKTHSIPLHQVRLSDNGLSVQPVSPDFPQNFRFYFGAKSITGLDKGNFISALAYQASGSQMADETVKYSTPAQPSDRVVTVEQQEEAKQRKRRTWGWVFVIGSGLFTLMSICQTIAAIAYSFSSSAAEAVQKSGIIAIVAPLGCNALWLVLWGVLLGLSIKNLRSIRQSAKPTQLTSDAQIKQSKAEHTPPTTTRTASTGYSQSSQDISRDTANALLNAAEYGDIDQVIALLDSGVYVDVPDREKSTALGNAAVGGHIRVMEVLLDRGADPNAQNRDGITPLMRAAGNGHLEAVKLLLSRGADPQVVDREGLTALQYAEMLGRKEIAQVLRERMNL